MTYADDRARREEVYPAYVTRASAEGVKADGSSAAEWDNTDLISETLALRHEMAQLLGFENYAERSLATKMADTPEQVLSFLNERAGKSKPLAERDIVQLRRFAQEHGGGDWEGWWVGHYQV